VKSENRPRHITKGDVFDDLGLSRSEASALKVKATLLDAILGEVLFMYAQRGNVSCERWS
jgi:hypothetical protein